MKHCTSFREAAERPTNQVEAGVGVERTNQVGVEVEVEVEVDVEMNMTCLGTQGEGRTYDARILWI